MKQIPLTQGQFALVDDEDYDELSKHNWSAVFPKNSVTYYAIRSDLSSGKKKTVQMHRLILGAIGKPGFVDHKDGNGLNNQRSNIRLCTPSQNSQNKKKDSNCLSQFKGVHPMKNGKFRATIRIGGKSKSLGVYQNEESAAIAYDNAAKEYFGEFARLNFAENPLCQPVQPYQEPIKNQKRLQARNSSGFMGVSYKGNAKKFRARLMVKNKEIYLGHFESAELAAIAYDKAVRQYLGENAPLNFP